VVTSFEYQLHPVGPVLGGEIIYPLDQAKEVLRFYRDWSTTAPDEARVDATLVSGPNGPAVAIVPVAECGVLSPDGTVRAQRRFGRMMGPLGSTPIQRGHKHQLLAEVDALGNADDAPAHGYSG
jgi:hypothetical protein